MARRWARGGRNLERSRRHGCTDSVHGAPDPCSRRARMTPSPRISAPLPFGALLAAVLPAGAHPRKRGRGPVRRVGEHASILRAPPLAVTGRWALERSVINVRSDWRLPLRHRWSAHCLSSPTFGLAILGEGAVAPAFGADCGDRISPRTCGDRVVTKTTLDGASAAGVPGVTNCRITRLSTINSVHGAIHLESSGNIVTAECDPSTCPRRSSTTSRSSWCRHRGVRECFRAEGHGAHDVTSNVCFRRGGLRHGQRRA